MKLFFALLLFITSANLTKAQTAPVTANNGLKGDLYVHDPAMIKQGNTYYIYYTGKGIPVKTSTDRINWKNAGTVFDTTAMPSWHRNGIPNQDGVIWAPDIHFFNGKYYLYYSVSAWMNFNSSVGFATNTTLDKRDPKYKWVDEGEVISYKNGGEKVNVIDPMVYRDHDGKEWLIYGSFQTGLRLVELDPKTGKTFSDKPELTTITPYLGEASFIIKDKAGWYYLFGSRGKCCKGMVSTYEIVMGRSKDIKGPYLNKKGESYLDNKYTVFLAGDSTEPGRGHNAFLSEHDTTFNVYHAYSKIAGGASLLNIKPVYADADGWPTMQATGQLFRRETLMQGKKSK